MCVSASSSVVKNVPLWWGMLIVGEAVHMGGGWEVYGKSLYFPPTLPEPRISLKRKEVLKNIDFPNPVFFLNYVCVHMYANYIDTNMSIMSIMMSTYSLSEFSTLIMIPIKTSHFISTTWYSLNSNYSIKAKNFFCVWEIHDFFASFLPHGKSPLYSKINW